MNKRNGLERALREHPRAITVGAIAGIAISVAIGNHPSDNSRDRSSYPIPTVTETVTVSPNTQNEIDPTKPIVVVPYHVLSKSERGATVDNSLIDKNMRDAYRYLEYDFENLVDISAKPAETISLEPQGREIISNDRCFTNTQLGSLAIELRRQQPDDSQAIVALVMDKVDQCETTNDDGSAREQADDAAATASSVRMTFKSDSLGNPYVNPDVILHETGHMMGLGHEGQLKCDTRSIPLYDPYDPALNDVQDILTEGLCNFELNPPYEGSDQTALFRTNVSFMDKVDQYSGYGSVMGYSGLWDTFRLDNAIVPAYSNLDRATVLPDAFSVETVDSKPGLYKVGYGQNERNGIKIKLPADHPMRMATGDAGVDELVVMVEENGGSITDGEEYKNLRRCGDQLICGVKLYAVSSTSNFRIQLPSTRDYYHQDKEGNVESVLYLDKALGIGITGRMQWGNVNRIDVVGYQSALALAQTQESIAAEYSDQMKQDDLMRLRNSKELNIAPGAMVLE